MPKLSPITWISTWRGCWMYFSTYTAPLPNAARASFCARPKSWGNCSASCAIRMPFPPPPAVALMMTGKPIVSANASASSGSSIVPGEPGTVGTPASGGQAARGGLVAHLADLVAGRADEGDVRRLAGVGELGVLRQEAVARMDGVGAGDLGGGDDVGDLEVGLAGWAAGRCRRRRPRSGRAATRGRPRSRPPPSRARARGTRESPAGRSPRGWRSGPS